MQKKRLLKLADLLEEDAKNEKGVKFDLGTWGEGSREDELKVSCGTTACAFGLAALSGAFKRSGLGFKIDLPTWHPAVVFLIPTFTDRDGNEWESFDAAREFFGIKQREVYWLFSEDGYGGDPVMGAKGERKVAARIRAFVEGKKPPKHFYDYMGR